ncbi:fibronectin type III domain-containing protein [Aureisphaera galaxeae]|uniref:fibronectin type III domain-containing protein n=1 Tax=Aureisphaera galaxeae TaxID=1538023 RepID=UPI0023503E8A|nr:fibronectin type III domain-containing protein [Aureisphaera galaxeae]MDC8002700.1 fibronectin type III domain-containing protein [Aureisphaera galaxeae]
MKNGIFSLLFLTLLAACSSDDAGNSNSQCDIPVITISNEGLSSVTVSWTQADASSVTLEYGEAGFTQGSGIEITASQSVDINNLMSSTDYEIYAKANCGNGGESSFSTPISFSTLQCIPATGADAFSITDVTAAINYNVGFAESYQVEYGPTGFTIGSGTLMDIQLGQFQLTGLTPNTTYDVYLVSLCGGSSLPIYTQPIQFTTDTSCRTPEFFGIWYVADTAVGLSWSALETAFEVEYGLVGFELGTGTVVPTSISDVEITGLSSGTTYEFYLRANCGSEGFSNNVGPLVITTEN